MKNIYLLFAALMLATMPTTSASAMGVTSAASASQWYSGGTLHRATANQWRLAAYANKLATAADWVAAIMGERGVRQLTGGDMSRLRPYAAQLVTCIDEAAPAAGNQRASELAAACMVLLGYR